MLQKIASYIEQNSLLTPGARVISALSGGADSICLTHILIKLGYDVIAAHCNFHLRGTEADRDTAFVEKFCSGMGIKLRKIDFDTNAYASEHKIGTEEAARILRYGWFEQLRQEEQASAICVAHHSDDSIETALLNLVRGAGITGICGIRNKNGYIVRPLLCVSKKDIEKYLMLNNLQYMTDSTNLENNYNRNKIRNVVIPELEKIKPTFKDVMLSNMDNFTQVAHIYNSVIVDEKKRVLSYIDGTPHINLNRVMEFIEPATLLFELLKEYNVHPKEISKILTMETGKSVSLSNAVLTIKRIDGERQLIINN
ncbi:MAG: tRNA lysidine(34) synthetase TilS [Paludibacteraceae bacterium]|nr:tRNA lysidine(34) synthetase TilS [Paludibacteraceae bacterium]